MCFVRKDAHQEGGPECWPNALARPTQFPKPLLKPRTLISLKPLDLTSHAIHLGGPAPLQPDNIPCSADDETQAVNVMELETPPPSEPPSTHKTLKPPVEDLRTAYQRQGCSPKQRKSVRPASPRYNPYPAEVSDSKARSSFEPFTPDEKAGLFKLANIYRLLALY